MSVAVVIPYGPSPARQRGLEFVLDYYRALGVTPHVAVSLEQPFPKAAVVNDAVRRSDAEIVVLNDADSLVPVKQLNKALYNVACDSRLWFAYDLYHRLGRAETARLTRFSEAFSARPNWSMHESPSHGCVVMRRESFLEVGGLDESYVGWGYEDIDFNRRMEARFGPAQRVPGELVHLWHGERASDDRPLDADPEQTARNWQHYTESVR